MTSPEPVPPRGEGLDAVADVARRRSLGWTVVRDTFAPPDEAWAARLRTGEVHDDVTLAVGWRSGELGELGLLLVPLHTYTRVARRRPSEDDLPRLRAAFEVAGHEQVRAATSAAAELLALLCRDEGAAWATGRVKDARGLRMRQVEELRGDVGDAIAAGCDAFAAAAPAQPYLALGRIARLWLDKERRGVAFAR